MRDLTGGEKAWSWVKKGIPMRIEIGAKEVSIMRGKEEAKIPKTFQF